jgi:Protein of unknown function (DUF3626)
MGDAADAAMARDLAREEAERAAAIDEMEKGDAEMARLLATGGDAVVKSDPGESLLKEGGVGEGDGGDVRDLRSSSGMTGLALRSSGKSDTTVEEAACPVCGLGVPPAEIERHVDACLRGSGGQSQAGSGGGDGGGGGVPCPCCMIEFPPAEVERHVNRCLGGGESTDRNTTGRGDSSLFLPEIDEDAEPIPEGMARCPMCLENFQLGDEVEKHAARCSATTGRSRYKCPICQMKMSAEALSRHVDWCKGTQDFDKRIYQDEALAISLTRQSLPLEKKQLQALSYVTDRAQKASELAYDGLVDRFGRLGYTEGNLHRTLLWIRNEAPIIVHVDLPSVFDKLLGDSHYRNQFETNTSRGTLSHDTRTGWEDRLFGKMYAGAKPVERVKYGVLNIVNDPAGVRSCQQYGDSVMVLAHNTRIRCTFASKDSGYEDIDTLATTEHYCHVLADYDDNELKRYDFSSAQ